MSNIDFTNTVGALFPRLGKLGALIKNAYSYQQTQNTSMTNTTTGVVAQYNAESDLQAQMGSQYITQLDTVGATVGSVASTLAVTTCNRIVYRAQPRISQTLTNLNITASLQEIIRQMKVQGATVLAMTIGATPQNNPGGLNVGNGVLVISTKRPEDGLVLENSFAETVQLTCTQDSYIGGAVAGNETFTLQGTGNQANYFAFNWPLGSNAQATLNAINGNSNNSGANGLTNSNWATWSGGLPSNYTIVAGGGNLFQETVLVYDGSSCLRWQGDGTTNNTFKQLFGSTSGTPGSLTGLTQYSYNIFMRRDGVAAGTGILTISLVDGGGTVINDANGVPNSFTIDLTALTTNYQSFTNVFRLPQVLPSSQYLQYSLTTALTNGRSVYLAKASQGVMTQSTINCPYFAIHAGSVPFAQGDFNSGLITNSRGAAGTLSTFQTLAFQLISAVGQNEFLLPSSLVPSISDALIA